MSKSMTQPVFIFDAPDLQLEQALANAHQAEHPFCLDVGNRYTFIGFNPVATFSADTGFITVKTGQHTRTQIDNSVQALDRFAQQFADLPHDPYLPFSGGLVGYVGFEWGAQLVRHSSTDNPSDLPDAWFGVYDTALVIDHVEQRSYVVSMGLGDDMQPDTKRAERKARQYHELCTNAFVQQFVAHHDLRADDLAPVSPKRHYRETACTLHDELGRTQVESINFAQRYVGLLPKTSWETHLELRQNNPSPYTAYLHIGSHQLSCSSPTCSLQVEGKNILARPVLGHGARSNASTSASEVAANTPGVIGKLHRLRAEFAPLIDEASLTESEAQLLTDKNAYHLVYDLRATLSEAHNPVHALAALVPSLSMTGYPKPEAISLLAKHEPFHRNAYTGAMGYLGSDGRGQFNVCVRLLSIHENLGYVHAASWLDQQHDPEVALDRTDAAVAKFFSRLHQQPIETVHEQSLF